MADFNSLYQQNLYLSPEQQNLLMAALNSNTSKNQPDNGKNKQKPGRSGTQSSSNETSPSQGNGGFDPASSSYFESPLLQDAPGSGHLGFGSDESPFLDFDPDVDYDFQGNDSLIGDLPDFDDHEAGEKRKSLDGNSEDLSNGKKRRESDDKDKAAKKPGRKPLTSEPTTKRKAQNRAAQRAFRERKEKHLKDLETKVDELEKASQSANHENGLLRAQVERLQVELREYRKRISWLSNGNGLSAVSSMSNVNSRNLAGLNNNDFYFDFPKFGDLPGNHIFKNSANTQKKQSSSKSPSTAGVSPTTQLPGGLTRGSLNSNNLSRAGRVNGTSGSSSGGQSVRNSHQTQTSASSVVSNTNSPSASSDSQHGQASSIGTSPEPSLNSPNVGKTKDTTFDYYGNEATNFGAIDGQLQPTVADQSLSFDWLAQQNGGNFDPVLFNDYREPQDAILSQDFGAFFNDAFPLPDLGSPFGTSNDLVSPKDSVSSKKEQPPPTEEKPGADDEVVPGEDKSQILSCTNIWDRLQSMEKFRNGEIDIDSLCSELRTKARCSEGGVVVFRKDVDDIMGRAGNENKA